MKESYVEGLASYGGPESCVYIREGVGEALTGVRAGRVLSRVIHDLGLRSRGERGAEAVEISRRPNRRSRIGEAASDPAHARKHFAREPGDPATCCGGSGEPCRSAHREAFGRTTMSQRRGKSDRGVVPKKLPNKAAGEAPAAADAVEGRPRAKGNALVARMSRRTSRVYDVQTALDGIRQTARGRRDARFDNLLFHIYAVERLQAAYHAVKRDAAAGVDGQTWQGYGMNLEANLLDLSDRLARGGYRPLPVKRAYIDKADGSKRPLGVPALEDKIVQRASAEVLG